MFLSLICRCLFSGCADTEQPTVIIARPGGGGARAGAGGRGRRGGAAVLGLEGAPHQRWSAAGGHALVPGRLRPAAGQLGARGSILGHAPSGGGRVHADAVPQLHHADLHPHASADQLRGEGGA